MSAVCGTMPIRAGDRSLMDAGAGSLRTDAAGVASTAWLAGGTAAAAGGSASRLATVGSGAPGESTVIAGGDDGADGANRAGRRPNDRLASGGGSTRSGTACRCAAKNACWCDRGTDRMKGSETGADDDDDPSGRIGSTAIRNGMTVASAHVFETHTIR
jgi:hypothetical protein